MKRPSLASSLGRKVGIGPRGGAVKRQDTARQQRRETPSRSLAVKLSCRTAGRHAGETIQHLGLGDGRRIEVLDRLRVGPRDHRRAQLPIWSSSDSTLVSIRITPVDPDSNQVLKNPAARGRSALDFREVEPSEWLEQCPHRIAKTNGVGWLAGPEPHARLGVPLLPWTGHAPQPRPSAERAAWTLHCGSPGWPWCPLAIRC